MISLQIFHFVTPRAPKDGRHKMEFHRMRIRQRPEKEYVFEEDACYFQNCLQDGRWLLLKTKNHPQTDLERHDATCRTLPVTAAGRHYDPLNYSCEHLITEILIKKAISEQVPLPLRNPVGQCCFFMVMFH